MFVVVKSNMFTIVRINTRGCDDWTTKVMTDVFYYSIKITKIRFCIDIETIFVLLINCSFCFLEGGTNHFFHFIKESSLESLPEISVVEMFNNAPKAIVRETALGEKTVDMGILFQGTTKCVKNTDKARNEVFRFIYLVKHGKDNTADSLKKAVQKIATFKKEVTQLLINCKDAVTMCAANKLK